MIMHLKRLPYPVSQMYSSCNARVAMMNSFRNFYLFFYVGRLYALHKLFRQWKCFKQNFI